MFTVFHVLAWLLADKSYLASHYRKKKTDGYKKRTDVNRLISERRNKLDIATTD